MGDQGPCTSAWEKVIQSRLVCMETCTPQRKDECLGTVQHLGTDSHCESVCQPRAISPQRAHLFKVSENKAGTVSPSSILSDFPLPFLPHPLSFLPYPLLFSCLLCTPFVCSVDLVSFLPCSQFPFVKRH